MSPGLRTNGYASLRVALPRALPANMCGPVMEIVALKTRKDKRQQGEATALVTAVCEEADNCRRFLFLHVDPDGPMNTAELAYFYARFGFQAIQAEPLLMLRPFDGAFEVSAHG